jgi:SAM-dependent MidA family methyltransferase
VGRRGDFSTSATLGSALAAAIAKWVREQWKHAGRRLPVIEVGPGDGSLQRQVLSELGLSGRVGLRCHSVERSPVLRALQRNSLHKFRRRLAWDESVAAALEECRGRAVIFSNEVADAFPATLLERADGEWREVWLALTESGGVAESLRPRPDNITSTAFGLDRPDGQRIEVLHSWREWLESWRPLWKEGAMLTIDYGGTPAEVYHRRPNGTARGYFHHQRLEPAALYPLTGKCDVTVDVNFSDLRQWGEASGLATVEYVTQHEFVRARVPGRTDLLDANRGAAEAFRCLVQRPAI